MDRALDLSHYDHRRCGAVSGVRPAHDPVDFYVSKIDRGGKGRGKRTADKDRNAAPKDVGDVFDGFSQNNRAEGEEAENPSEDDKDVDKKEDCGEDGNKGVDGQ